MVLNIRVSALSIERFWSTQDKVMDKRRGSLKLETAGRLTSGQFVLLSNREIVPLNRSGSQA